MPNKLAAAFLRCALGPLDYAGGCIVSSKVGDGLRELSPESLQGGFQRGVQEAAKHVGIHTAEVERLLPMGHIEAAVVRLAAAHETAIAAWATYAGHIGGLLQGVADLTADGRAPDVSNLLERLSKKVIRDRPLADPLHALSVETACWLDLVEHCGDILADGGVLARAYTRRRIRRGALLGVGVIGIGVTLSIALHRRALYTRVDAALAAPNPCSALAIDPADLDHASVAQKERAEGRRVACEAERRREEEAREAERVRDEKKREEARIKQAREMKCEALARRLASGDILPEDEALFPGKGAFLRRVAKRSLDKADMLEADRPCMDTPSGAKIVDAIAAAVVASPAAWANMDDVSDPMRAILLAHRAELPHAPLQQLVHVADNLAKRAVFQKTPTSIEPALRVCKLKDDLDVRGAQYCPGLASLRAAGKL